MNLSISLNRQYTCLKDINLYDNPDCKALATQSAKGRQIQFLETDTSSAAIPVYTVEDGYVAWLSQKDLIHLTVAEKKHQFVDFTSDEITAKLPGAIAFARASMAVPNEYLWGGTVAPNYDCSGLMQAAFSSQGIWLPRDSYQQGEFTERVSRDDLQPGDLIFFAKEIRINHVALYLGDGYYIHSSGREIGHNGIGIDQLSDQGDTISQAYYALLWGFGRVTKSWRSPR